MKKVTRKRPSIHPNSIGTCIMCKVIYLMDIAMIVIVLKAEYVGEHQEKVKRKNDIYLGKTPSFG